MKNDVVPVNITENQMIIVIIVDMEVKWIVRIMKGGEVFMTERRFKGFTSSIDYYIVEDTLENRYLSKEDVINALNKFWVQYEYYEKENKQLKKGLDKLKVVNEMLSMDFTNSEHELWRENEQLKQSVNNLKDTIIKITIAYQRKYDRTIVDLVDEVHEEDITDLIKELQE